MKTLKLMTIASMFLVGYSSNFTSLAQSIEPNTHPVQTACVAVSPDGKETTVGYSNDCALGGNGCIDNTCPGAPASVG